MSDFQRINEEERIYVCKKFKKKKKVKIKAVSNRETIELASSMRFELTTYRLGGDCSIQLSYEDIIVIIPLGKRKIR